MKILTIVIPCYNSAAYMRRAVESALTGDEDVEVLIVDDGSADGTADIAEAYAREYPHAIRTIHQPNRGHGGAVMAGLAQARGEYFKVLDSDDWLDESALSRLLRILTDLRGHGSDVDMVIANYVYEKAGAKHKHVVQYANALPVGRRFGWEEIGRFHYGQYLLMHSVTYRTQLLRNCGLKLPEHTFYVDNLYVYAPLPMVKSMFYLDDVLYHYSIGREDQSVQETVMIKNIDQQLLVNQLMFTGADIAAIENRNLKCYMRDYLEIITAVSSVLLLRAGTREHLSKKDKLWQDMKNLDPGIYRMLRWRPIGILFHLPGKPGRAFVLGIYRITQRIFGYN